jgi:hypothetical protein
MLLQKIVGSNPLEFLIFVPKTVEIIMVQKLGTTEQRKARTYGIWVEALNPGLWIRIFGIQHWNMFSEERRQHRKFTLKSKSKFLYKYLEKST